ncbi:MAG: hypothetical protein J5565_05240 [Muribaculaceae bacterium]|nr:hypothetical protein [Muribaculaceae bacterium]
MMKHKLHAVQRAVAKPSSLDPTSERKASSPGDDQTETPGMMCEARMLGTGDKDRGSSKSEHRQQNSVPSSRNTRLGHDSPQHSFAIRLMSCWGFLPGYRRWR